MVTRQGRVVRRAGRTGAMAIILLAGLAALLLPPGGSTLRAQKTDNKAPKPMQIHVGITLKWHQSWPCKHEGKFRKCDGCQDDGTVLVDLDCKMKPNVDIPLMYDVVSGGANVKWEEHFTCPIDGEQDSVTGQSKPDALGVVQGGKEPVDMTKHALITFGPVPWGMHYDVMSEGEEAPTPSLSERMAHRDVWIWQLFMCLPPFKVRRALPGSESVEHVELRLYADMAKSGPSAGSVSWDTKGSPGSALINLNVWKVENLKRGTIRNAKGDGDWQMTATVGWRFGGDRRVRITDPEENHNCVFGSSGLPGKLRILPEATTGNRAIDLTIEPWSIDPIAGSDLEIVTFPGGSKPARGPEAKITFDKMPTRNDAFGRKTIKCDDAIPVTVKVFFKKEETDNPDGSVPNWFYYWKQGAVPNLDQFHYVKRQDIYGQFHPPNRLEICDPAGEPEAAYQIQLYQTIRGAHVKRPWTPRYYLRRGMIKPWQILYFPAKTSIESCHCTVLHEIRHKEIYEMLTRSPDDADGDGVPAWLEKAVEWGLDPLNPDTHFLKDRLGAVYAARGDNELLARVREMDFNPHREQDWAWPGSQSDPPE